MGKTKEITHGTVVGYSHHKCRCDECRAANAAAARKWRKEHPGYATKQKDNWRKNNPNGQYNYHLRKKYGIEYSDYEVIFEAQKGLCKICNTSEERLVVDHNHDTGAIRALLCGRCNSMLSGIEDRDFLNKAISYLQDCGEEVEIESQQIQTYF